MREWERDQGRRARYSPKADLPAFTYSPDGASIFVGGNLTGVATATVADALRQGPSAFHKVFGNAVWGLAFDGGKLYAGNDDYAMKPPFMVGVSTNEAETFSPVMNHCQVTFPTCPATSTMESVCRNEWERYGGYAYDQLQTDDCAKRLAASGGAAGAPTMTPYASATGPGPGSGGSLTGAGGVGPSPSGAGGIAESPAATTGHDGSASCSTARRARGLDPTSVLVAVAALSAAGARARRRSRRPVRFTRPANDPL